MKYILSHQVARQRAIEAVKNAPDGYSVKVEEPKRSLDQNALIHPLIRQIYRHMEKNGAQKRTEQWWRDYFVAKYAGQEIVPDGDGGFVVMNKTRSSNMSKSEATEFIEWLYAFGVDIGVEF